MVWFGQPHRTCSTRYTLFSFAITQFCVNSASKNNLSHQALWSFVLNYIMIYIQCLNRWYTHTYFDSCSFCPLLCLRNLRCYHPRKGVTFPFNLQTAMPGIARPTLATAPILAPVTIASVAPIIPPPGIAIPQTLTRPAAIIQPMPGQPVIIPPPAVITPTVVGNQIVSTRILFLMLHPYSYRRKRYIRTLESFEFISNILTFLRCFFLVVLETWIYLFIYLLIV